MTNERMKEQTNGGEIKGPFGFHPGPTTGWRKHCKARPKVRVKGFWCHGHNAFFDIRVTNVKSDSQHNLTAAKVYTKHQAGKKKNYNQRIMQVEHGTFTPLIFSVHGRIAPECERYHKHIAKKIAKKAGEKYNSLITGIRCNLSFLLILAALMCDYMLQKRHHNNNRLQHGML